MRKKGLALAIVIAMTVSLTVGCSKTSSKSSSKSKEVTVESITDNAQSAIEDVESYEGATKIGMDVDFESLGYSLSIKLDADLAQEVVLDDYVQHSEGTMEISMVCEDADIDENEKADIETYSQEEDGSIYTYTSIDGEDWTYDYSYSYNDIVDSLSDLFGEIEDNADDFELDKSADKINGKKVNIISGSMQMSDLQAVLSSSNSEAYTVGYVDGMEDEEADIEIWFYEDSDLPAKISFDLTKAFEAYAKDSSELDSYDSVTANSLLVELQFTDYDCVDDLEVPDDVLYDATYSTDSIYDDVTGGDVTGGDEPDDEVVDGTISYCGFTVKVGDISGYTYDTEYSNSYYGYYYSIDQENYDSIRTTIDYYSDEDITAFLASEVQYYVDNYDNASVSEAKSVAVGDRTAYYQTVIYDFGGAKDSEVFIVIELGSDSYGDKYAFVAQRSISEIELDETALTEYVNNLCSVLTFSAEEAE